MRQLGFMTAYVVAKLIFWSRLAVYVGMRWFLPLINFFVVGSAMYGIHRLGHVKWTESCTSETRRTLHGIGSWRESNIDMPRFWGNPLIWVLEKWHRIHFHGHHELNYPSTNFSNPAYRINPLDHYLFGTLVYLMPAACIVLLQSYIWSLSTLQTCVLGLQIAIDLVYEEWLHQQIHTMDRSNLKQKRPWVQYLYACHLRHHTIKRLTGRFHYSDLDHGFVHEYMADVNFGVANLFFDWLYGTLDQGKYKLTSAIVVVKREC